MPSLKKMSNLKKIHELARAITIASHPMLSNGQIYETPTIVSSEYGDDGKQYICWLEWSAGSHVSSTVRQELAAAGPHYADPDEAIENLYDRMLIVARGFADSLFGANASLLALVAKS